MPEGEIAAVFFRFNNHRSTRWMTEQHRDFLRMLPQSHLTTLPGHTSMLDVGAAPLPSCHNVLIIILVLVSGYGVLPVFLTCAGDR